MILHAGCVACRIDGLWRGALLTGPTGVGKSDLMLRLLGDGWRLVADDRVVLWSVTGRLYGRAPETLTGLVEARGLGVVEQPSLRLARVDLEVELSQETERIPEPAAITRAGVSVPVLRLSPRPEIAPAKLRHALFAAVQHGRLDLSPGGRMQRGSRGGPARI